MSPPNNANSLGVNTTAETKKQAETKIPVIVPKPSLTPKLLPTAPIIRTEPIPQAVAKESMPKLIPPPNIKKRPIRVGLLLPLSGRHGVNKLGQAMLNAALLALFEIGGERLYLLPHDTGGTPNGAAKAAANLVREGAEIILGPLFNTSVQAAASVIRKNGLPMISFSSDRRVAGNGVYLLSFTPNEEVRAVINYAASQGLRRFAVLAPDDNYGLAVLSAAKKAASRYDAKLVQAEFYPPTGEALDKPVKRLARYHGRRQNLLAQRRRLRSSNNADAKRHLNALKNRETLGDLYFDAILLPEGGELLNALAPLLPYYDIDTSKIRLLGTGRWDDPKVRLEPALIGGWFAGADRTATYEFKMRYEKTFGEPPVRLASLAYDAMALAAVLSQEANGPDFSAKSISNPNGFIGSDGIFRFGPDGIAERGMAILEIERNRFRVRQRAPATFKAPNN